MNDFLEAILRKRRAQIPGETARAAMRERARNAREGKPAFRFRHALEQGNDVNIIAEFKRASPSLGWIRRNARPSEFAELYEFGGAAAISVLTEPDCFRGSLEDLEIVRDVTALPVLRKDFVVSEFQIDEAAQAGADAVLLIVAALADNDLSRFRARAEDELGLDALVEVHSAEEMQRAKNCGAKLIGVNNRDLRTFTTSVDTSLQLAALAPPDATLVSESGISSAAEIAKLRGFGFRGFLIGESLMRSDDPAALIQELRGV